MPVGPSIAGLAAAAAAIGKVAMVVGPPVLSAYGTYEAGKQQEANAEYNAEIMEQQAAEEKKAAQHEAKMIRKKGIAFKASQRVSFAKAGVTGAGTPMLVLQDTANKIEQDIAMTLRGGQVRSNYYRARGQLLRTQGRSAYRAGKIGAATSLLSGLNQSIYYYKMLNQNDRSSSSSKKSSSSKSK